MSDEATVGISELRALLAYVFNDEGFSEAQTAAASIEKQIDPQRNTLEHLRGVEDSGVAYSTFRGWILTCSYCGWVELGPTKGDAVAGMQAHYDAICGHRKVEVGR